jgi:hypothetical protein
MEHIKIQYYKPSRKQQLWFPLQVPCIPKHFEAILDESRESQFVLIKGKSFGERYTERRRVLRMPLKRFSSVLLRHRKNLMLLACLAV